MAAGRYNITVEQGATFELDVVYEDANGAAINLTGCTAAAQIRREPDASDVELELTTSITGATGTVHLTATPTETEALTKDGWWDLEVTFPSTGRVVRLLEGKAEVSPAVTR